MGNRLSRLVTKTGDEGTTGMADGTRRSKNDARVHCLGEVDELNAAIGVSISLLNDGEIQCTRFGRGEGERNESIAIISKVGGCMGRSLVHDTGEPRERGAKQ